MTYHVGDRVKTPDGLEALVVAVDEAATFITVQLDGEATGTYPADRLTPAGVKEE